MKQETQSANSQEELKTLAGQDGAVRFLLREGLPLTRENYLSVAWPDRTAEDELDAEFEAQLPEMFRLKT
jgi:hypothetical protein